MSHLLPPPRRIATIMIVCAALLPVAAFAYDPHLYVNIGTNRNFWQIMGSIISFLAGAIVAFAVAMFSVGALMITATGAKEDLKEKGKNLMVGAAVSIVIVLGAYSIFRTVNCFLTPGCSLL